jgi:hypothetical protein
VPESVAITGNGSAESPFVLSRTSDAHRILRQLNRKMVSQSLVKNGDRMVDILTCDDGSQLHFDVTAALAAEKQRYDSPIVRRPLPVAGEPTMDARPIAESPPIAFALSVKRMRFAATLAPLALAVLCAFPPWVSTFSGNSVNSRTPAGHRCILFPPEPDSPPVNGVEMDLPRLFVESAFVFFSLAAWVLLARTESSANGGSADLSGDRQRGQ